LDGETIVVSEGDNTVGRVPLLNIESIVTFGRTGASPALMGACAERNIPILFMRQSGKFLAAVYGEMRGNVLLRKQQYRVSDDDRQSLRIAKNIVIAKISNSRKSLERALRDHAPRLDAEPIENSSEILKGQIISAKTAATSGELRGIEGAAANAYFGVLDNLILQQKSDFFFKTRNRRPPTDNVNALLSFVYSLVNSMYAGALSAVGLDPYVGFFHTDRPGRTSLALDMMEELRAVLADRFVLTLINNREINGKDFIKMPDGAVHMTDDCRKRVIQAWQQRKKEELTHPFLDEKVQWGLVPHCQALLLARYLREDLDEYPPFFWR
jgi:CRISPR-associated protein Cas1